MNALKIQVFLPEELLRRVLSWSRIEFPEVNCTIPAAGNKAVVVFEPANRAHRTRVLLECVVLRAFGGVELVDRDVIGAALARKKVAAMREHNFVTVLDRDFLIGLESILENVEHL